MKHFALNWKTTSAGASAILLGLSKVLDAVARGETPDFNGIVNDLLPFVIGTGLLYSKDGDKADAPRKDSSPP